MQLFLSLALLLSAAGAPDVAVLRWQSPDNSKPLTFAEWRSGLQSLPWRVETLIPATRFNNRVDFFVQETLVPALRQSLDTLAADLARETTDVAVFSVSGTSAESLKALLAAEYQTGMTSAVFVGDLPIAWFQLIDDWNSNGMRDPGEGYEEFPCDLFFMDLDGTWADNMVRLDSLDSLVPGSDSIYDLHDGTITPEIAVSRLPASKIGDAAALLTAYFDKSHRYRNGELAVSDRALVYIDDDWIPNSTQWYNDVGLLYPDRVYVVDAETTRIADYRPRIDSAAYQWISLMSHSWPGGHGMKYSDTLWDWFYARRLTRGPTSTTSSPAATSALSKAATVAGATCSRPRPGLAQSARPRPARCSSSPTSTHRSDKARPSAKHSASGSRPNSSTAAPHGNAHGTTACA
jgi:hypothetical protein